MLILLSPAKAMNFDPAPNASAASKPVFARDTAELAGVTRKLSRAKLKKMMNLSDALAELNFERFQAFKTSGRIEGAKQAALAFNGDVYWGLEANTLDARDFEFAQDHLRILSGLYGLLRPLDAIQPYRLVMGMRIKNPRGATLYDFWGDRIAKEINKIVKKHADTTVVNLASNEYFSAVDLAALNAPIVTPIFKEEKDGRLRQLQFFAKRARGEMARWIIQNRIETAEELKRYSAGGYKYREGGSNETTWLFDRPQPKPKVPPGKKKPRKKAA